MSKEDGRGKIRGVGRRKEGEEQGEGQGQGQRRHQSWHQKMEGKRTGGLCVGAWVLMGGWAQGDCGREQEVATLT